MSKEYHKHIVSTPEHQVWLHRTSRDLIDKIMKEGLLFLDLSQTATLQPSDISEADAIYRRDHGTRTAVAVVKIPGEIFSRYYSHNPEIKGRRHEGYSHDKEVSYWHPAGKYAIQRQHIHGWIDKETEEYHPNPYLAEPQELTEAHFPKEMYGGLEKDVSQDAKKGRVKGNKKKERAEKRNFKRGILPPPPSEITVVP